MKNVIITAALAVAAVCVTEASAKELILVNNEVTTHIVMPENIKMVDLSTTKIIGNQCADNIVRIKPYIESDSIPKIIPRRRTDGHAHADRRAPSGTI